MLCFDELFECLVLLIACRMNGKFSWQTAILHWPFSRPMIAWLELTIADVHEYAEMMNRSISDDQERQVALSMEHHGCPPGLVLLPFRFQCLNGFEECGNASRMILCFIHSVETGLNFLVVLFGQLRFVGCEPTGNGGEISWHGWRRSFVHGIHIKRQVVHGDKLWQNLFLRRGMWLRVFDVQKAKMWFRKSWGGLSIS